MRGGIGANDFPGPALLQPFEQQQPAAQYDEAAGRQDHDHPRFEIVAEHLKAEQLAGAQQFPDTAQAGQREGKSHAHAGGADHGFVERVLGGKGFGAAQDQAVHDDQLDKGAQGVVQIQADGLNQVIDQRHEGRDDDDVGRDADLLGDEMAQPRILPQLWQSERYWGICRDA